MNKHFKKINDLAKEYTGKLPEEIQIIPQSGSNRCYYRILVDNTTFIATYNDDIEENEAFIYITKKLKEAGVRVPEILSISSELNMYLQEDLGNVSLFDRLSADKTNNNLGYLKYYRKVIDTMPSIQIEAAKDFDYSVCYPRKAFDKESIIWDLNYFKYYFLKLAYVPFHEQRLEDDFQSLAQFLLEAPNDFFLFRDFQSRNIMIIDDEVAFIDYQGGRKGALQYDLASLLFDAKAKLSHDERSELLDYYLNVLQSYDSFSIKSFLKYYPAFVLIRILQAFGAYGYRGYYERKSMFLKSIPPALENLRWILDNMDLGVKLPQLSECLYIMTDKDIINVPAQMKGKLNLTIYSFSYKKGIPDDYSGNGGGYVFDCRMLHNPGRYEKYKHLNGKDKEVIDFFEANEDVHEYLESVEQLISRAIDKYLERGFEHLMVSFGCTGGQHRSVYCAESIAQIFSEKYNININLIHREQNIGIHDKNDV